MSRIGIVDDGGSGARLRHRRVGRGLLATFLLLSTACAVRHETGWKLVDPYQSVKGCGPHSWVQAHPDGSVEIHENLEHAVGLDRALDWSEPGAWSAEPWGGGYLVTVRERINQFNSWGIVRSMASHGAAPQEVAWRHPTSALAVHGGGIWVVHCFTGGRGSAMESTLWDLPNLDAPPDASTPTRVFRFACVSALDIGPDDTLWGVARFDDGDAGQWLVRIEGEALVRVNELPEPPLDEPWTQLVVTNRFAYVSGAGTRSRVVFLEGDHPAARVVPRHCRVYGRRGER